MNVEYHKWFSPSLNQEMELKTYGHGGKPLLVFPAQGGRFFDFENFGMVGAVHWFIDTGYLTLYTVDSVDAQSWTNFTAHPHDRAARHENFDRYIVDEVVPLMQRRHPGLKAFTTGCSMGGYHSANFFFRHPQVFDGVISLSGLFSPRFFIGDYMDDLVYFNSPLNYLANLEDPLLISLYKQSEIIICVGQGAWEEEMRSEAGQLKSILEGKGIPAWIDFWGHDVNHDWPWWQKQLPYFISKLLPVLQNQISPEPR
jgi:esterase/lipase superfamily enzyme